MRSQYPRRCGTTVPSTYPPPAETTPITTISTTLRSRFMLASLLASLHGHAGGVWGVALTADGRLLASGSEDGAVRLLEVLGGRLMATLTGQAGPVYGVALKPLWVA